MFDSIFVVYCIGCRRNQMDVQIIFQEDKIKDTTIMAYNVIDTLAGTS